MERGQCGLKQAFMSRSFPYACLSLGISRPPAGKMRPTTLTCKDLHSVCPMLTKLFIIYSLAREPASVLFFIAATCWQIISETESG